MAGGYFVRDARALARFDPERMTKQDCFRSDQLFLGLNCLVRGQTQAIHTHAKADKFYLVVSGKASILVGDQRQELGAGGVAWAPAGVAHGIERAEEDTVVLVAMAPPP